MDQLKCVAKGLPVPSLKILNLQAISREEEILEK